MRLLLKSTRGSSGLMCDGAGEPHSGQGADAVRYAKAALAENPRLPSALAVLGHVALTQRNADEAIRQFQKCLEVDRRWHWSTKASVPRIS